MVAVIVIIGLVVLVGLWVMVMYNKLVKNKNLVEEGWSGIDVQLKRRANLIPNLVETVKGYAGHEKDVLTEVTESRTRSLNAGTVQEQAQAENQLGGALRSLFAVAENYPDLKANQNFLDLQQQLSQVEDQIQMARRYYNGAARNYNILTQQFPSVIVANTFGFDKADYFEIEDQAERAVPQVAF
jgi:LemA protein